MDTTEIVALIGVTGVLSGVVGSYVASSRTLYISSITIERNKWIDKLRLNLAAFCTEAKAFTVDFEMFVSRRNSWEKIRDQTRDGQSIPDKPEFEHTRFVDHFRKMQDLANIIQLQLNPDGTIDKNIIKMLQSEYYAKVDDYQRTAKIIQILIWHSQWLLKAEWEKVKYEGGSWWYQLLHHKDESKRKAAYLKWSRTTGSLAPIETSEGNQD